MIDDRNLPPLVSGQSSQSFDTAKAGSAFTILVSPKPSGDTWLHRLEQVGKSFGWFIQIVIAMLAATIAYFAFELNSNQFQLNEDNYNFQQKSLALQAIRDLGSDSRRPDEIGGYWCSQFVLQMRAEDMIEWWDSRDPKYLRPIIDKAGRCAPSPYDELKSDKEGAWDKFNKMIYLGVTSRMSTYETYLNRIVNNIGDKALLCKQMPDIDDYMLDIARRLAAATSKKYAKEIPELVKYSRREGAFPICQKYKT